MKPHKISALTITIALIFAAFWFSVTTPQLSGKMTGDFLTFYNGWSLGLQGKWADLYNLDAQMEVQRSISAKKQLMVYGRPPVYALLFAPMALIPFQTAFWVWISTWTVLLEVCCWWLARRFHPDALVFGSLGVPILFSIGHGQDAVLLLAIMIVSFRLMETGRDFSAGAVAAICCFKPHLIALVPILYLTGRRWRALAGFISVSAVHGLLSILLVGISGIKEFVALVVRHDLPTLNPTPETMPNVHAIFRNVGIEPGTLVYIPIAVVVVLAILASRGDALRIYAVFPPAAILISPHVYYYDTTMFLLSACLIAYQMRSRLRDLALILATPGAYLAALLGSPWPIIVPVLFFALLAGLAFELWLPRYAGKAELTTAY